MSSALRNLVTAIEAAITPLAPPDRPDVRYRFAEGPEKTTGTSADRVLWFELPTEFLVGDEAGNDMTGIDWAFGLGLRLIFDGLSQRDQFTRLADEVVKIVRTLGAMSALGDGVTWCRVDGAPTIAKKDNSIVVTFALRASTNEVD